MMRDLPGWPPRWNGLYRGQLTGFPQGEVGTLWAAAVDPDEQTLILAIELDGDYGTGFLPLPRRLLQPVEDLLRASLGMPVDAVGALPFDDVEQALQALGHPAAE